MNILIAGHDLKFINFYIEHIKNSKHNLEIDEWANHVSHDIKKSFDLLDWADVIFCEWGLGNSVFYSQNKRVNQKLVVRLHRQELETNYLKNVNIDNIDNFITVSPYIYEEFSRIFNLPRKKMRLIYNAVNLEKFTNNNNYGREYKLGLVGYLPKLKRMDLALDIFEQLYNLDNKYTLHFKGKRPEELRWLWRIDEEREYYQEQFNRIKNAEWKDNIIFEPFGDVVEFYNDMEFILSVSDIESFHLATAEGMACGTVPIIMNWEGSDTIYDSQYIVNDLSEIPEYIEKVRNNKRRIQNYMVNDIEKFDIKTVTSEIDSVLLGQLDIQGD